MIEILQWIWCFIKFETTPMIFALLGLLWFACLIPGSKDRDRGKGVTK